MLPRQFCTCQAGAGVLTSHAMTLPSSVPPSTRPPGAAGVARAHRPESDSEHSHSGRLALLLQGCLPSANLHPQGSDFVRAPGERKTKLDLQFGRLFALCDCIYLVAGLLNMGQTQVLHIARRHLYVDFSLSDKTLGPPMSASHYYNLVSTVQTHIGSTQASCLFTSCPSASLHVHTLPGIN